jgi:hypothetical protein
VQERHFVGVIMVNYVIVIMIIRVFALYNRSFYLLGFLLACLSAQVVIFSIGLSKGHGKSTRVYNIEEAT